MDTEAFLFNSQAKYRTGSHFKEKADILSLANQEKGSHFKAMVPDIFADYQNPPFTGELQWQTRHGKSGKTLPSAGGSASLTPPSGAPLPVEGFHLRTTSKRRSPFLPACTAFTSTIRPSACLKSCVSPSQGINLIHGTRMHMTPEPTSGFALSSPFLRNKTGGRSWITDVKVSDLGVPS